MTTLGTAMVLFFILHLVGLIILPTWLFVILCILVGLTSIIDCLFYGENRKKIHDKIMSVLPEKIRNLINENN